MAGSLVQGAVFTVMVVRAGMLRDPAFGPELAQQIERSPRNSKLPPPRGSRALRQTPPSPAAGRRASLPPGLPPFRARP